MRAFSGFAPYDRIAVRFSGTVECPAWFDALQDASKPFMDPMRNGNFPSYFLFVGFAGIQITEAIELFRLFNQRRLQNLLGYLSSVAFVLPARDLIDSQQTMHSLRAIQLPKFAFEDQAIKTVQDTGDKQGETL
jgi:hypothetical protein